ncbi:RNase H domain-containing protein [Trichonephila clavipes]|uniref:ribonuclease H n=1 Tax=Trichonephila clavipes TaxID=2585209 RepID=A0A8X6V901_TRICX|nr:RNase H domain-containing protein [Trichonephila clavipes]
MKRLYDARPSNIRPFMDRMKLRISELDLPNVPPVVFQRVFAYHRSQYSRYSTIYTDGSKRADYVGCGVVIEDIMHGYRLDTSCSIFTAEAVAICRALQLIDSTMPRKYCIYTDSMSVLEALENYHDRCHPVVCTILDITSRLYSKGFDIVFCWLPSHVGIIGNEQADSAAKSATTHLPLAVPLSDMKRVIMHHIFKIWQESWSQQLDNKLHSVKPVIGAWPVMPMRRTDVKLTRLRIGHTRFTHRHLLFGERAPECPSCHVSYTVRHILIDCPVFNHHRITFFHTSILTLSDLGFNILTNVWRSIAKFGSCAIKPNTHSLTHRPFMDRMKLLISELDLPNVHIQQRNQSLSVEHHSLQFCDSFRFFIVKTPDTFTNVSPFLIEKAFTSSIGEVKSIRKMRSGTCSSKRRRRNRRPPLYICKSSLI